MRHLILIFSILSICAGANAQITLDRILDDVASIEKKANFHDSRTIDYCLQTKLQHDIATDFRFNPKNDTIYIIDDYVDTGTVSSLMISSRDSVSVSGGLGVFDAAPLFARLKKRPDVGFSTKLLLIKKWDTKKLKEIGVRTGKTHPSSHAIVARIIVRNGKYTIDTVDFCNDGFEMLQIKSMNPEL